MNEIKEYKVFETSDGQIFKDKKEATDAQKKINSFEGLTEFFKTFLNIETDGKEDITINVKDFFGTLYDQRNELMISFKGKRDVTCIEDDKKE